MKIFGCLMTAMMLGLAALAGEVSVTDVTARQRYPWNGKVDITVTLTGASNDVAQTACRFVATNSATHAALNVSHVTGDGVASGSGGTWTRKFVWDATADLGEVKIADVALTVEVDTLGGVQLWKGGPYWAECNVGATKPEEYGYYFWWGDTVGYRANTNSTTWKSGYYWNGVTWVSSEGAYASRSIFLPAAGYGSDSDLDGPGSYGDYWSSTPNSDDSYNAWSLGFNSGYFSRYYDSLYYRFYGRSVRPLRGFAY